MIEELKFENFRGFASLELKDLKRVNLVVGENNAGKTSLLEAVFLLCNPRNVHDTHGVFRLAQGNADTRYLRWLLRDGAERERGMLSARIGGRHNRLLLASRRVRLPSMASGQPGTSPNQLYAGAVQIVSPSELQSLRCRGITVEHRDPARPQLQPLRDFLSSF